MRLFRFLACLALPLLMAACGSIPGTTYDLDRLKTTAPTGPAFTQALTREYQAFAESERDQYDWIPMWHFSRKGVAASQGVAVQPENPSDWSFQDPEAGQAIVAAHGRLLTLLTPDNESRLPALLATAQVKFDCWVLHQHEGWQADSIAACRNDFTAAMSAISGQLASAPTAPPPPPAAASVPPAPEVAASVPPALAAAPAPSAPEAAAPPPPSFRVFFKDNQSTLDADAKQIVAAVLAAAKANPNAHITLTGYTDATGAARYNQILSERRAQTVARILTAAGIPSSQIIVQGKGSSDPLVTGAGKKSQPQNRRVEIQFSS